MAIEMKLYIEECARLRSAMEKMEAKKAEISQEEIEEIENNIAQQNNLIKKLKQENAEILQNLQKREEEIKEKDTVIAKLKQKNGILEAKRKVNLKERQVSKENVKVIKKLKEKLSFLKVESKDQEFGAYQTRIEDLLSEQSKLKEKLDKKEAKIKSIESKKNVTSSIGISESEYNKLCEKLSECILICFLKNLLDEQQIELIKKQKAIYKQVQKVRNVSQDSMKILLIELKFLIVMNKMLPQELKCVIL